MKLLHPVAFIIRMEARYLTRYPRLLLVLAVVVLVPSLYAYIYLQSLWDPEGRTQALPVALVNHDEGVQYREYQVNMGQEIEQRLLQSQRFGFVPMADAQVARDGVRSGALAFALIVPAGFSANAIPGAQPGAGKLVLVTSPGNSYQSAAIARQFAETLGREVNQTINERRWALALRDAAGSHDGVERLRVAMAQLREGSTEVHKASEQAAQGARELVGGARSLHGGVEQLGSGFKQLASGVRTLDARRPHQRDLSALRDGAQQLADGHTELDQGLQRLHLGSQDLLSSVADYRAQVQASLFVPSGVADNVERLHTGLGQLESGLGQAHQGQKQLSEGAHTLSQGVQTLTTGVRSMNQAIHGATDKLPEDDQIDTVVDGARSLSQGQQRLADGLLKLSAGTQRLQGGLDLLAQSLPHNPRAPEGNASALAHSVEPVLETLAPVRRSGESFAANVLPAALWLGAGVAAFLVHVRVLPRQARLFRRWAQLAGKVALPLLLALLQALVLWAMVVLVLQVEVAHPLPFAALLALTAAAFLLIVLTLTLLFGDAGKGLAMVLLAVQLSSSGGIVPVELSGGWYMELSPWLPLTWVVHGLKASLFDAYGGNWWGPMAWVALAGAAAAVVGCLLGRWRYVKQPSAVRPVLDL
ncbi:MAG: YhgE/Pip family protein [Rhodoferax sp.]